ncbi:MAG: tetratricopeptide repeat protein [Thermoanaerobaculia bacterium]
MKAAMLVVAAISLSSIWQQMTRPTNSKAATDRGVVAYERQKYGDATSQFESAASNDPSPQNLFNLGTAQIAAGQRTEGSATLTKAMEDPSLRAPSLFNRGNSALAANALNHANRDYTEVLKLVPKDAEAKRNLEIALRRKQSMQQQQQKQPSPSEQSQEQQPQPRPDGKQEQRGQTDAEALLRSVQQQEQEELARMKRSRSDSRRVGW